MNYLRFALFLLCGIELLSPMMLSSADNQRVASAQYFLTKKIQSSQSGEEFSLSTSMVRTIFVNAQTLLLTDFPVGLQERAVLNLHRVRAIADANTEVHLASGDSSVRISMPEIHSFRGTIAGEPKSRVFLTLTNGEMFGIIERGNGQSFAFTPSGKTSGDFAEHTLRNNADLFLALVQREAHCKTEAPAGLRPADPLMKREQTLGTNLLQVDIALEILTDFYKIFQGNTTQILNYTAALYEVISGLYEDEINVTLYLPWIWIWRDGTDTDPYINSKLDKNEEKIVDLQQEMGKYWQKNRQNVKRGIAEMLTLPPQAASTYVAGISAFSLCDNTDTYSVVSIRGSDVSNYLRGASPTAAYSSDVGTTAHEIGHHFRGFHTHSCYWNPPLDTCVTKDGTTSAGDACFSSPIKPKRNPGTIMSYCHLINGETELIFSPRVAADLRAAAEKAPCLTAPTMPVVLLQNPIGNQKIPAGRPLEIRWTSALVQSVSLEFSQDSGATWQPILGNISAATRKFLWTIPKLNVANMMIRVFDSANPLVGDTCLASFQVAIPNVTLQYPAGGERVGQNEPFTITWLKEFVKSVLVEFSANNGASWETVSSGNSLLSFDWHAPEISTTQAVIRVTAIEDKTLLHQSSTFSIGKTTLSLLVPNGGEEWLAGSKQKIRWTSDFANDIRIQYSLDSGATWKTVKLKTDGKLGEYEWTLPTEESDRALVRIISYADLSGALDTSARTFRIIRNASAVEEYSAMTPAMTIAPNPASEMATIHCFVPNNIGKFSLRLNDALGREVQMLADSAENSEQSYTFVLNVAGLAQGIYYVVLSGESGERAVKTFTVFR